MVRHAEEAEMRLNEHMELLREELYEVEIAIRARLNELKMRLHDVELLPEGGEVTKSWRSNMVEQMTHQVLHLEAVLKKIGQ
jgi:hypothetical protein